MKTSSLGTKIVPFDETILQPGQISHNQGHNSIVSISEEMYTPVELSTLDHPIDQSNHESNLRIKLPQSQVSCNASQNRVHESSM